MKRKQLLFTIIVVVILRERICYLAHTTSHVYEEQIEIAPKVRLPVFFILSDNNY